MADDEQGRNPETEPGPPPAAVLSISLYANGTVEPSFPENKALAYELLANLMQAMDSYFKRAQPQPRVVLADKIPAKPAPSAPGPLPRFAPVRRR